MSGLIAIKAAGGLSIVQHPDEARHESMPASAIRRDHVDAILTLRQMADVLPDLVAGAPLQPEAAATPRIA